MTRRTIIAGATSPIRATAHRGEHRVQWADTVSRDLVAEPADGLEQQRAQIQGAVESRRGRRHGAPVHRGCHKRCLVRVTPVKVLHHVENPAYAG